MTFAYARDGDPAEPNPVTGTVGADGRWDSGRAAARVAARRPEFGLAPLDAPARARRTLAARPLLTRTSQRRRLLKAAPARRGPLSTPSRGPVPACRSRFRSFHSCLFPDPLSAQPLWLEPQSAPCRSPPSGGPDLGPPASPPCTAAASTCSRPAAAARPRARPPAPRRDDPADLPAVGDWVAVEPGQRRRRTPCCRAAAASRARAADGRPAPRCSRPTSTSRSSSPR